MVFSHILAPKLQHFSCPALSARDPIKQFSTESDCHLQTLQMRSGCEVKHILHLLSHHPDALVSVHTLDVAHACPHRYSRGNTDSTTNDGLRIIELLARRSNASKTDSVDSRPMKFFPHLRRLRLSGMTLPIVPLIDMLQSQRGPELDVRLGSCSITRTLSLH
ncbi:hypothetical protein BDV98DRAFT_270491 [Pterulicium gracile]|uniref:Uncharacterized protein n=1 Tax=Pterulicium gracile TaxID=1884261 RepID=A0A5C3QAR3_9AGAR|nr:hypothetical protein BDV98DRAFT_270491 [Pterula gracilis]